jgi:Flp pilus assembly protein CpaB
MSSKKNILPIVIASGIALVITGIVKFLMPEKKVVVSSDQKSTKELSMPDIPLMVQQEKEKEKQLVENQVLVTAKDIKKGGKVMPDSVSWKKWPRNAMQPYFIAKDEQGKPLNNPEDYNNALKMWAPSDIPAGIPLTTRMLSATDPQKLAEIVKKSEKVQKKKMEKKKNFAIGKGMRAITFSIDQKSANSSDMLHPGDYVDVLIIEQQQRDDNKAKIYKYEALKILAIDGDTKVQKEEEKDKGASAVMVTGLSSVGVLLFPKNVTLEIQEDMVEEMLRRAGNTGVILSLRNQSEKTGNSEEKFVEKGKPIDEGNLQLLMKDMSISGGNSGSSSHTLMEVQNRKESEERSLSMIMRNMSSAGGSGDGGAITGKSDSEKSNQNAKGKYEIVSGKVVEDDEKPDRKSAVIYRKLEAKEVKFDEDGRKVEEGKGPRE